MDSKHKKDMSSYFSLKTQWHRVVGKILQRNLLQTDLSVLFWTLAVKTFPAAEKDPDMKFFQRHVNSVKYHTHEVAYHAVWVEFNQCHW